MNPLTAEPTEPEKTLVPSPERILTSADLCDGCGVPAFGWALFTFGETYLCGHHFALNEEKIKATALKWIDERKYI